MTNIYGCCCCCSTEAWIQEITKDRQSSSKIVKIGWMSASNEPKKEAEVAEVVEKAMEATAAAVDQQIHI